ncbi:MAG: S8 family serine peptidase [Ignavibacteria bacterium]|jgi:hypothetical protein
MNYGDKILIGVIDSGIDINFLNEFRILPEKSAYFKIDYDKKLLESRVYNTMDLSDWLEGKVNLQLFDSNSHGTSVTSIIHRNVSDNSRIKFSFAKILDETNLANGYCLIEALRWMIDEVKPHFINLSLGGEINKQKDLLNEVLLKAQESGIKIFCSATGTKTLPAELPLVTTIGDKGLTVFRREETKVDYSVDDEVVDTYENGEWKKLNMTTSFACPLFLARYINENILQVKSG